MGTSLCIKQRVHLLNRVRDARSIILADAESYHSAARVLEEVGQVLIGKLENGLGGYRMSIVEFISSSNDLEKSEVRKLFDIVKEGRNTAVHEGTYLRNLSTKLDELLIHLEDALVTTVHRAEDLMVPNPTTAEPWQLVAHIRKIMLAHSYSYVPFWHKHNQAWSVVSDVAIAKYLNCDERKERLAASLETAIEAGLEYGKIEPVAPETLIEELRSDLSHLPVLVVDRVGDEQRLLGILTPFDLL